jgi:hypothetical protein
MICYLHLISTASVHQVCLLSNMPFILFLHTAIHMSCLLYLSLLMTCTILHPLLMSLFRSCLLSWKKILLTPTLPLLQHTQMPAPPKASECIEIDCFRIDQPGPALPPPGSILYLDMLTPHLPDRWCSFLLVLPPYVNYFLCHNQETCTSLPQLQGTLKQNAILRKNSMQCVCMA